MAIKPTIEHGAIIGRVISDITATSDNTFSSIDYNPPRSCHVALVCCQKPTEEFAAKILCLEYVESIEIVNHFINLSFNNKLVDLFSALPSDRNQTASVEHTSTVPVYPLSVAVFRSSIIGEWIRRSLAYLGYSAKGRIWVQESARQVSLVSHALKSDYRVTKKSGIGKGDHTIGRIFAESILSMDAGDDSSMRQIKKTAANLFPLGQSGVRRPWYSNWINDVLLGWRSSFDLAGIHVDHFDKDQKILPENWKYIIAAAREINTDNYAMFLHKRPVTEENLTYIERSILYYCFLLGQSNLTYSVVPNRQLQKLSFARFIACSIEGRDLDDLTIIPVGDVKINNHFDSIKSSRFTTIDNLDQYANRNINCLLEKYLTMRASSNINISFPLNPIESYVGLKKVIDSSPLPKAVLLLDELPLLLKKSISTGDFSRTTQWTARARVIRDFIDIDSPSLAQKLSHPIDLFSPFPSKPRL